MRILLTATAVGALLAGLIAIPIPVHSANAAVKIVEENDDWLGDFEEAKKKAKSENKDLFIFFNRYSFPDSSGAAEAESFYRWTIDTREIRAYLEGKFVCVELDANLRLNRARGGRFGPYRLDPDTVPCIVFAFSSGLAYWRMTPHARWRPADYVNNFRRIEEFRLELSTAIDAAKKSKKDDRLDAYIAISDIAEKEFLHTTAIYFLEKARKSDPRNKTGKLPKVCLRLAEKYFEIGKTEEGAKCAQIYLKKGEGGYDDIFRRSRYLSLLSRWNEALKELRPLMNSQHLGKGYELAARETIRLLISLCWIEKAHAEIQALYDNGNKDLRMLADRMLKEAARYEVDYEAETDLRQRDRDKSLPEVIVNTYGKGQFTLELFLYDAPEAVSNFLSLAESGYYNDTKVTFAGNGKTVEMGHPCSKTNKKAMPPDDAWGGPGYMIANEAASPARYRRHFRGTVAMTVFDDATKSSACVFFVNLIRRPDLDGVCTVFGRVTGDMSAIESLNTSIRIKEVIVRSKPEGKYRFEKLDEK